MAASYQLFLNGREIKPSGYHHLAYSFGTKLFDMLVFISVAAKGWQESPTSAQSWKIWWKLKKRL